MDGGRHWQAATCGARAGLSLGGLQAHLPHPRSAQQTTMQKTWPSPEAALPSSGQCWKALYTISQTWSTCTLRGLEKRMAPLLGWQAGDMSQLLPKSEPPLRRHCLPFGVSLHRSQEKQMGMFCTE